MNYTTYERPIDLYSDCQNYFIGIIENNLDKDYIVWRSGYSTNALAIGHFIYKDGKFVGKAEQVIFYSGFRTNQEQYNIQKGGADNGFSLSTSDKNFAFSNVSCETSSLHGVQATPQIHTQITLVSGLFLIGILVCQLCKHRSSGGGKIRYS